MIKYQYLLSIGVVCILMGNNSFAQDAPESFFYGRFQPAGALSYGIVCNSQRDSIDIPSCMRRLSLYEWEERIAEFLGQYYQVRFPDKGKVTGKHPPTISLSHIKNYITGPDNYWENIQVELSIVWIGAKKLWMECSINGEYVPVSTPSVTEEAFDTSNRLEKDYDQMVRSLELEMIRKFGESLKHRP